MAPFLSPLQETCRTEFSFTSTSVVWVILVPPSWAKVRFEKTKKVKKIRKSSNALFMLNRVGLSTYNEITKFNTKFNQKKLFNYHMYSDLNHLK